MRIVLSFCLVKLVEWWHITGWSLFDWSLFRWSHKALVRARSGLGVLSNGFSPAAEEKDRSILHLWTRYASRPIDYSHSAFLFRSVGIEIQLERAIRSCFRLVYFDSIRLHAHRGCLLNGILYRQPIWFQARLIYLLFGPMTSGRTYFRRSVNRELIRCRSTWLGEVLSGSIELLYLSQCGRRASVLWPQPSFQRTEPIGARSESVE